MQLPNPVDGAGCGRRNLRWRDSFGDTSKSVLVVDDDPTQQIIVTDFLEQLGRANVINAADGDAARFVMEQHSEAVGLIVCDLHMPDFDGVEFLQHRNPSLR